MIGADSAMTSERWQQIKRIFDAVVDSTLAERAQLLFRLCGGDSQLELEINHLLAAEKGAESFLQAVAEHALSVFAKDEIGPSFHEGQVVANRFEIQHFIARGGMGEVYEVWDRELQQSLALKTISRDIYRYPGILARFKSEVKESLRITHPNVCRVYQLASSTDAPEQTVWFLTMELLDGPTLAQYLRENGPMPYSRAYASIRQIVSGLACAHQLGIIHRDLKPGNLMIANSVATGERLVITDFGLAMSLSSQEASGLSGSPDYMAPELRHGGLVGLPADIWALGLIICEILTGQHPDLDTTSSTRCRLQLDAWLAANPKLPRRMRAIVHRCLRSSPEDRFQSAEEIVPLLEKRRTARIELGISAVLVLAAITTVLFWGRHRPTPPLDLEPLTKFKGLSWDPSLSGDGKTLTYSSDRNGPGKLNIWIQDVGSDSGRQLTHDEADDVTPELSPDGQSFAYRSYRDGGGVYIAPIAGGSERLVAKFARNPHFSPRGDSVLYWTGDEHFIGEKFVPDGRSFVWSRKDGSSSPLMPHYFVDARYPVWSPDGDFILLQASRNGGGSFDSASDLWVIRADGRSAIQTGAFDLFRSEKLVLFGCPFYWTGDSVIFSARKSGRASLWELPLGRNGRIKGPLTRLTGGGASDDISPWVSRTGMLAVASTNNDVNVWRAPMSAAGLMAPDDITRVTSSDGTDQDPSVSVDGKSLVFKRRIGSMWTTILHRTDTGEEAALAVPELSDAIVNSDGSQVAYSVPAGGSESILVLPIQGGEAEEVCHNCGHVVDWTSDKVRLLYHDRGRLAMLDMPSSRTIELLPQVKGAVFDEARFSPDGLWVAFPVTSGENASHIEIVNLKGAGAALSPFAITNGDYQDRHPAWSSDGKALFMYSNRDGFDCVWRIDLQPQTKLPVHPPQAVVHFHYARLTPRHLVPTAWRIAAGDRFLYLNLGEMSGNVFRADLNSR